MNPIGGGAPVAAVGRSSDGDVIEAAERGGEEAFVDEVRRLVREGVRVDRRRDPSEAVAGMAIRRVRRWGSVQLSRSWARKRAGAGDLRRGDRRSGSPRCDARDES